MPQTAKPKIRRAKAALLMIDMLNEFSFPEGKMLLRHALPAARAVAKLKARLKKKKFPSST